MYNAMHYSLPSKTARTFTTLTNPRFIFFFAFVVDLHVVVSTAKKIENEIKFVREFGNFAKKVTGNYQEKNKELEIVGPLVPNNQN